MSRLSIACAAAIAIFAVASPTYAQVVTHGTVIVHPDSDRMIQVLPAPPPPPPRMAHRPGARRGNVWVEGHWEWRANRYRWVDGYWMRARPGYGYSQPQWVQRNGQWVYVRGEWRRGHHRDRDRDRDGIPNRYDRHPNNPHR